MIDWNKEKLYVYYFGQIYGFIERNEKFFKFYFRNLENNEFCEFDKNSQSEDSGIDFCTKPFFNAPINVIEDILHYFTIRNSNDFEYFIFKNYKYTQMNELIQKNGSIVRYFYDENNPEYILDIITLNNDFCGIVYCDYFESLVFTTEGMKYFTPVQEWFNGDISKADRGCRFYRTDMVPMRDSVLLYTEIYVPADYKPGNKLPTIVSRTPYGVDSKIDICFTLAALGYILVFQDCRGRGKSEGKFLPFICEGNDSEDTLKYIEEQEWFNGSIGGYGGSYGGYYQWPMAFSGRDSLKCIAPFVSGGSCFDDHIRRSGSFQIKMLPWMMQQSYYGKYPNYNLYSQDDWMKYKSHRPVLEIPERLAGKQHHFLNEMADHIAMDEFWKDQDFENAIEKMKVPALLISGPFDGDNTGNERLWYYLEKYGVKGRKLIYGPWGHWLNHSRKTGLLNFGSKSPWYCLELELVKFYERYLKQDDVNETVDSEVDYFIIGKNRWEKSRKFPDESSEKVIFYLGMKNEVPVIAQTFNGSGFLEYSYDPLDAPPQLFDEGIPFGANDYSELGKRNDVLMFSSDMFSEDKTITGRAEVNLFISSDAPDTDFVARLILERKGKFIRLADNLVVTKFRNGYKNSEFIKKDEIVKIRINLPMMNILVKKNEKIHLQICSAMKDLMVENPNNGGNIFTYKWDDCRLAKQRIYYGNEYPGQLVLFLK